MLVRFDDEDFPFCSDRCRKIDLGKWASGVYKISSPVLDPDVLEDLGGEALQRIAIPATARRDVLMQVALLERTSNLAWQQLRVAGGVQHVE